VSERGAYTTLGPVEDAARRPALHGFCGEILRTEYPYTSKLRANGHRRSFAEAIREIDGGVRRQEALRDRLRAVRENALWGCQFMSIEVRSMRYLRPESVS